jgi:hypothetical protein
VVLQERIELSTSPLPRECSTTELLQRRAVGYPSAMGRVLDSKPDPRKPSFADLAREIWTLPALPAMQWGMSHNPDQNATEKPMAAKPAKAGNRREDRLKAALKANMGRRKAQARARAEDATDNTEQETE